MTGGPMEVISVIGAGGMGCAVAKHLSELGHEVRIYTPFRHEVEYINGRRENPEKLPGVILPEGIKASDDIGIVASGTRMIVIAVPSQMIRRSLQCLSGSLDRDLLYVNCSKGIENITHLLPSEIIQDVLGDVRLVVLSGPSHAEEIAGRVPTAMVSASLRKDAAQTVQDLFSSDYMRIYTSDDVRGVELAGALKNVIALCSGIVDGLGYGDNTKAALMTRGMAEIARLGEKMGARRETFFGLAGIGDLIVTCTSVHSRNRRAGIRIGQGIPVAEAVEGIKMTVEGYDTCRPAYELSQEYGVSMPLTAALYEIIYGIPDVEKAVRDLMLREKKDEFI
jgi:glycerol-3-phosphate dehydrogenase (NAD(P)+)